MNAIRNKHDLVQFLKTDEEQFSDNLCCRICWHVANLMLLAFKPTNHTLVESERKFLFKLGVEFGGLIELTKSVSISRNMASTSRIENLVANLITKLSDFQCGDLIFEALLPLCSEILEACSEADFSIVDERSSAVDDSFAVVKMRNDHGRQQTVNAISFSNEQSTNLSGVLNHLSDNRHLQDCASDHDRSNEKAPGWQGKRNRRRIPFRMFSRKSNKFVAGLTYDDDS